MTRRPLAGRRALSRAVGIDTNIKRPLVKPSHTWTVPALCAAYGWPNGLAGGGVIGIVELGGGWSAQDVKTFFASVNLPAPNIVDVSVDATKNSYTGNASGPDGEVALDIQVAGAAYAVATGKPAEIRIYWSQDIAAAVHAAAADGCDVCSISWGADEAVWGTTAAQHMEQVAIAATTAGMIIFAASGDNDSNDGGPNPANIDLPASCPHVIGCGGTSKAPNAESVWNNNPGKTDGHGTGGGFSTLFPMPSWQAGAPHGPGRLVPDVAANADPDTGYQIVVAGQNDVVGGTSAVAPLYAGLFAAFGNKLGFVTPELYQNQTCFNDITKGDNGAYRAAVGIDPCTGLGSPIGQRLADVFTNATAIGARRIRALEAQNTQLRAALSKTSARDDLADLSCPPGNWCPPPPPF